MQKEIREFVAAISMLGLLAGCSETGTIEAKKDDTSVSAQNIRPFVDHDGLARRYEDRARKLLEIAAKHEKRLQYYEDKSSLYGRHGQDSQAQAMAVVQKYKLACKLAAEKATEYAFHHRTGSQLAKRNYIASTASH
jgi:outer membrane murein-binding lipoprotein Lpp